MLKAAIIYVQGSGGNLVARSLSLDPKTVAYLPKILSADQPYYRIDEAQRLGFYNNWDYKDWTASEKNVAIWYHYGFKNFVDYQQSELQLIDQFHPVMFETENQKKVLWENLIQWQNIIFIKYQPTSLNQIIKLAQIKRKDLNHKQQIPKEIVSYERLLSFIPNYLEIWWEDMLQLDSYMFSITKIADQLDLKPNTDMITQLWQNWNYNTQQLL